MLLLVVAIEEVVGRPAGLMLMFCVTVACFIIIFPCQFCFVFVVTRVMTTNVMGDNWDIVILGSSMEQ